MYCTPKYEVLDVEGSQAGRDSHNALTLVLEPKRPGATAQRLHPLGPAQIFRPSSAVPGIELASHKTSSINGFCGI